MAAVYLDSIPPVGNQTADPDLLWDVRSVDPRAGANAVVLFGDNQAGVQAVIKAKSVDSNRPVQVGYSTQSSGMAGTHDWSGVSFTVADLKEGQVAWVKGMMSASDFATIASDQFHCG